MDKCRSHVNYCHTIINRTGQTITIDLSPTLNRLEKMIASLDESLNEYIDDHDERISKIEYCLEDLLKEQKKIYISTPKTESIPAVYSLGQRIEILESLLNDHIRGSNGRQERLDAELKSFKNNWAKDVVDYQEKHSELIDRIKRIENLTGHDKKPHKCPKCEGHGSHCSFIYGVGYIERSCIACDNKGIVWG